MANQRGTSGFTFEDDERAPIHPSTPEGANNLFYGEAMPPKHELDAVVLGPPPFGSPDIRTLGHQMLPLEDGAAPASAPQLDPDWVKQHRVTLAGPATEDELDQMTKDELKTRADALGADYESGATKEEIKQSILDYQSSSAKTNSDENDESSEDGDGEDTPADYSSMHKSELLDLAKKRNLGVDESNTKTEIVNALNASDNQ